MKRVAALVGVLFSALLVSEAVADLRACEGAFTRNDWATALRECRPVAEQGEVSAQLFLGMMFASGSGVPQDDREAVKWFRRAAEQGDPLSQFGLGVRYAEGRGVRQDHREALKWFHRGAEQGDLLAQAKLGTMYFTGEGVPQDDLLAYFWLNLAASRAFATNREDLVKARDSAATRLTPEQRAKAQQMARDWKPKAERPTKPAPGN